MVSSPDRSPSRQRQQVGIEREQRRLGFSSRCEEGIGIEREQHRVGLIGEQRREGVGEGEQRIGGVLSPPLSLALGFFLFLEEGSGEGIGEGDGKNKKIVRERGAAPAKKIAHLRFNLHNF